MIERLDHDREFAQRQRKIAFITRLMLGLGIVRVFEQPLFNRFHPYMFLEIPPAKADKAPKPSSS